MLHPPRENHAVQVARQQREVEECRVRTHQKGAGEHVHEEEAELETEQPEDLLGGPRALEERRALEEGGLQAGEEGAPETEHAQRLASPATPLEQRLLQNVREPVESCSADHQQVTIPRWSLRAGTNLPRDDVGGHGQHQPGHADEAGSHMPARVLRAHQDSRQHHGARDGKAVQQHHRGDGRVLVRPHHEEVRLHVTRCPDGVPPSRRRETLAADGPGHPRQVQAQEDVVQARLRNWYVDPVCREQRREGAGAGDED
mmetsp:Transcript_15889/g.32241  ORF Transcript_15889/g.32241 Transcript_15889/m.32241 type:complete len:258 (-) Transcript_15889:194-967(-)